MCVREREREQERVVRLCVFFCHFGIIDSTFTRLSLALSVSLFLSFVFLIRLLFHSFNFIVVGASLPRPLITRNRLARVTSR